MSTTRGDHENQLIHANNRAETYSASVPSDVDLGITISYADSSEETQNRDDPCATSLEPLTEYALANEEDYLAKDHSDCEDDL